MEGPFGRSSETPDSGLEGPFSFGRSFGDPRSEGRRPPILEGPFWKVLWETPDFGRHPRFGLLGLEGPFGGPPILEDTPDSGLEGLSVLEGQLTKYAF